MQIVYKRLLFLIIDLFWLHNLSAITSAVNHRTFTTSPLLYKQIDYDQRAMSIDFAPIAYGLFDAKKIMKNISLNRSSTIRLDQQGRADINPSWLYLQSTDHTQPYNSVLQLEPIQQIYGGLFHWYKQYDFLFADLKTALISCTNQIKVQEFGGGNGGLVSSTNKPIMNALEAFKQKDFVYGKIGQARNLIGIDNLQITLGGFHKIDRIESDTIDAWGALFSIIEIPTGAGTKSEWLFEPQVGTNHWAFGFGVDCKLLFKMKYSIVIGGNFRHMIANWERRSFDLVKNGPWSRYLLVENIEDLDFTPTIGLPAINMVTQDALIEGKNQINWYLRWARTSSSCLLELSYNLLYTQSEKIKRIVPLAYGFGIYDLTGSGGVTTASDAMINQAYPIADPYPTRVQITVSDFDQTSGAQAKWLTSLVAIRLQKVSDMYRYGCGIMLDCAHTIQAFSSWSTWINFEILLP